MASINKEFLFDLIQQAYNLGTREIGLYSTAEPFASPNLEDTVAKASKIGFEYIYLTTNGALATPERMEHIFQNGLHSIKFSVNAGKRTAYEQIHGKNDFYQVIENIKAADALRKKLHLDIGIFVSFIEFALNKGQASILEELLAPYIDKLYVFQGINQGGAMYNEVQEKLIQPNNIKSCDMLFNRFHITPEGFLTACCVDFGNDLAVADLKKMSLKDAWNCENFVKLRRQHLSGIIEDSSMCYNCMNNTNNTVLPVMV